MKYLILQIIASEETSRYCWILIVAKQQEWFTLSCLLLMAKQSDLLHTPHKVQGQLCFVPSDLQSGLELFLSPLCLGRILYQQSQLSSSFQKAENEIRKRRANTGVQTASTTVPCWTPLPWGLSTLQKAGRGLWRGTRRQSTFLFHN